MFHNESWISVSDNYSKTENRYIFKVIIYNVGFFFLFSLGLIYLNLVINFKYVFFEI
jgi:hypothetical protein